MLFYAQMPRAPLDVLHIFHKMYNPPSRRGQSYDLVYYVYPGRPARGPRIFQVFPLSGVGLVGFSFNFGYRL